VNAQVLVAILNNKLVELEITDLAFDGKSVAHLDGKVVFLKGGLPGETVLAEITNQKPRHNQGIVREIVKPSDMRVDARCSHFDYCGGCTWQDLIYNSQLVFKKKQVADCIERIGKLDSVDVADVVGSVELFHYRNKMEFSFHVSEEKGFTLGLHRQGHFDDIFDVETCYLQSSLSNKLVAWVRDFVREEGLPVYDVYRHTGYMRFLMIRLGKRTGHTMVNLVTNVGDFPCRKKFLDGLRGAFPEITTVVHNQNGQKSNIATGEIEKVLFGAGYIEEKLFGKRFRIRANSFFQTNSIQTETLYRNAFDMLQPRPSDRLLDLYCGTGSIGLLVADYVSEVVGGELIADAVKTARENAAINETENITFAEGFARNFLKTPGATENHFDIVVVDPPRAGMNPKALKRMLQLKPEKLLYISCNPATFARDAAAIVSGGYNLPQVRPVDMFPHTMHIELIGMFYLK
jgi:23S rRNA (uracil1939-C5)-methyltransferase